MTADFDELAFKAEWDARYAALIIKARNNQRGNNMNINIYLRDELDGDRQQIGVGDPDDLDRMVKSVSEWGYWHHEHGDSTGRPTAVGQYFVDRREAGFEIIVQRD